MGEPAVVTQGLYKSFGAKHAVIGMDLTIVAGSLAGLVGPTGAGKTTSLSMMTGLLRPDIGRVLVNGVNVWADPVGADNPSMQAAGSGGSSTLRAWSAVVDSLGVHDPFHQVIIGLGYIQGSLARSE